MTFTKESPKQQFVAVDELLGHWLEERQVLLARYTEIVVATDSVLEGAEIGKRQAALSELLVDYVSAGHFEVFHKLVAEAEGFADGSSELATRLMPAIADTTEVILAYDEKYSTGEDYPETLERDLSALGEVLESRFVLEDQLIAGLHTRHRSEMTTSAPSS
ncbi:MAG: Rsd/AlgQ family anti-sigma factor [Halieaceae bacterium]|jgi:regulator of sigma D|nr:Rsd/AlgQ family anti-sigma factor [Halieaceae bacterium]